MNKNKKKLALTSACLLALGDCASTALEYQYQCDDGLRFVASFVEDKAHLTFDNGKEMDLNLVRSASGARYMSQDQLFVLHTKRDEALLIVDEISKSVCRVER